MATTTTSDTDLPPTPPKPTAKDRAALKARIKARLAAKGMSGRRLEEHIGMPTGTLSKFYSGRLAFTTKALREIASALNVGPEVLVEGTTFVHLLLAAAPSPASEGMAEATKIIDDLRAELAEKTARVDALEAELVSVRRAKEAADASAAAHKREVEALTAQLQAATAKERATAEDLALTRRELKDVSGERDQLVANLAAMREREATTAAARDQWRKYALERAQRVAAVEAELNKMALELQQQKGWTIGAALLSGITALGLGIAAGTPTDEEVQMRAALAPYRRR